MMATLRSDGRRLGLRSRNGTRIMSTITKVGKATPAIRGGKRESSSCRPRKYQGALEGFGVMPGLDRKSTRLNSSHLVISYAVFCLKKQNSNDNYLQSTHHASVRSEAPADPLRYVSQMPLDCVSERLRVIVSHDRQHF